MVGVNTTTRVFGPFLTINSTVNITVDANSIWSNQMGIPGIEALGPLVTLKNTTGCAINNTSIAGQTWAQMAANVTDVSATYVVGKTNVLIAGETRNSIFNGRTVAQTVSDVHDYVNAVLAAKPWQYIVLMGALPSDGVSTALTNNSNMITVENYLRDHLADFSAKAFCYYRDIPYFSGDGASQQGFMLSPANVIETASPWVHPRGAARDTIAARMAVVLQQIPL